MTYDLKSGHFCIKSDRVMTRNSITNSLKVNSRPLKRLLSTVIQ